jgi:hypothetical protein
MITCLSWMGLSWRHFIASLVAYNTIFLNYKQKEIHPCKGSKHICDLQLFVSKEEI